MKYTDNIKIGDIVACIKHPHNNARQMLTLGYKYQVVDITEHSLLVMDDGYLKCFYTKDCFTKYEIIRTIKLYKYLQNR